MSKISLSGQRTERALQVKGTNTKIQKHEKVYCDFSLTFNMTTPQIIGEAGRGLNVGGPTCHAKDKFRLDRINDKEQLNNLNCEVIWSYLHVRKIIQKTEWKSDCKSQVKYRHQIKKYFDTPHER